MANNHQDSPATHEPDTGDFDRELLSELYGELKKLASAKLRRESSSQTLQPTALVHEVWIRLTNQPGEARFASRAHFFAAAAEAMRRILIERARRKATLKFGRNMQRVALPDVEAASEIPLIDLLALDEALQKLEQQDPRKAELVKLRFFAGMSVSEASEALGVSISTAENDWAYARCWLKLELQDSVEPNDEVS